jgi:hypothetical protein
VLTAQQKSIDCIFWEMGVGMGHYPASPEKDFISDILKKKLQKLKFCS